jgi:hypothetical protein
MGTAVEYQKVMSEIVFINLPGPKEPKAQMTGGELLHGFLSDLYQASDTDVKTFITSLCGKWNVHYRNNEG